MRQQRKKKEGQRPRNSPQYLVTPDHDRIFLNGTSLKGLTNGLILVSSFHAGLACLTITLPSLELRPPTFDSNDYKIVHMNKARLVRLGLLPQNIEMTDAADDWLNDIASDDSDNEE
jgi:hypothetical protein